MAASPAPRVDFYVIADSAPSARLRLACRLAEKAYQLGQAVLVWHTDEDELASFDEMLWTFGDGSFVPHDFLVEDEPAPEAPVVLSPGIAPQGRVPVLINLAPELPGCVDQADRVIEIIDGDPERRQAGRARFKAWRDRGVEPATHNLKGGSQDG
jgi:DNA polymerase-3 subunit chi